jgi:tryptophan-rich sensory protein
VGAGVLWIPAPAFVLTSLNLVPFWIKILFSIIVMIWVAIAITIIQFRRLRPTAAVLLVPYLLWVSYATYLNAGYA